MPNPIRFDDDDVHLCDDTSSIATLRSASVANSSDDFSIIDADGESRSSSAGGSWDGVDEPLDRRDQEATPAVETVATYADPHHTADLPELSHEQDAALPICNTCAEDRDECSCHDFLPAMTPLEPITPPSLELLAPIDVRPEFGFEDSHSSHCASSISEESELRSSKTPSSLSIHDKSMSGLVSPRIFDFDDVELQNDMLLTLRYLDYTTEQAGV